MPCRDPPEASRCGSGSNLNLIVGGVNQIFERVVNFPYKEVFQGVCDSECDHLYEAKGLSSRLTPTSFCIGCAATELEFTLHFQFFYVNLLPLVYQYMVFS